MKSADVSTRSALVLFAALATAMAFGLLTLAALDPLASIAQALGAHHGWALLGHGLLGLGAVECAAHMAGKHHIGPWSAATLRRWLLPLLGLGLLGWLLSAFVWNTPDARGLLWLELLPLWLWTASWVRPFSPAEIQGGATSHSLEHALDSRAGF